LGLQRLKSYSRPFSREIGRKTDLQMEQDIRLFLQKGMSLRGTTRSGQARFRNQSRCSEFWKQMFLKWYRRTVSGLWPIH
jgi:hypothetical protein